MDHSKSVRRSKQFPIRKLNGLIHFHYDNVELGPIKVFFDPSTGDKDSIVSSPLPNPGSPKKSREKKKETLNLNVNIESNAKKWSFVRSYKDFYEFDKQLHRCVFDRRFSKLPELSPDCDEEQELKSLLSDYLRRFSDLAGSLITCYPVLKWLELDNRGNHLLAVEDSLINIPGVAAAYVVRNYSAQANNEINLYIGDIISVIDMPPPSESFWWRGKLTIGRRESRSSIEDESASPVSCDVGFFPSDCVQLFGNRVEMLPLVLRDSVYEKPVFCRRRNFVAFFRNFFATRPARRRLKESGILWERVFGCDLAEHLQNTGQEIPHILKCCCQFIETHGIVDGVYRLSGASSNIQRLRCIFDEKKEPNLCEENILRDVHCVASVLKMYFRELPNPLLTYHLYPLFIEAAKIQDHTIRLLRLHDVVQRLPPPYFRTADYLIKHLSKIASYGSKTGMNYQNLSIVWAPNLLRCVQLENVRDSAGAMLRNVNAQAVIVEYLIRYAEMIFSRRLPLFASNYSQQKDFPPSSSSSLPRYNRPQSLPFPTPTKLIDLGEAQRKLIAARCEKLPPGLTSPDLTNRKCIDVNGGPDALPVKYHTVIDVPSRCTRKGKRWREIFGSSTLTAKLCSTSSRVSSNQRKRKFGDNLPVVLSAGSYETSSKEGLRHAKSAENISLLDTPPDFNCGIRMRNRRSLRETTQKHNFVCSGVVQERQFLKSCLQADLDQPPAYSVIEPQASSRQKSCPNKSCGEHFCHSRPYSISVHVNLEPLTNSSSGYAECNFSSETCHNNSPVVPKNEASSSASSSFVSHVFLDKQSSFNGFESNCKSKKVAKVSPMNENDDGGNSASSNEIQFENQTTFSDINHTARSIESALDVVSSPEPQITTSVSIPSTLASVCTLNLFDEDGDIVTVQPQPFLAHGGQVNKNFGNSCNSSLGKDSLADIDFVCRQFLTSSGPLNPVQLFPPTSINIYSSGDSAEQLDQATICSQVKDLLSSISSVSESTGTGGCGSSVSGRSSINSAKKCATFEQANEMLKSLNDLCGENSVDNKSETNSGKSSTNSLKKSPVDEKETDIDDLALSLYENVSVENRPTNVQGVNYTVPKHKKLEVYVKRCNSEMSSETRRPVLDRNDRKGGSRPPSASLSRSLGLKIADAVALYEKALNADNASKLKVSLRPGVTYYSEDAVNFNNAQLPKIWSSSTPTSRESTLTRKKIGNEKMHQNNSNNNIQIRAQSSYESADENELVNSSLFCKQRTSLCQIQKNDPFRGKSVLLDRPPLDENYVSQAQMPNKADFSADKRCPNNFRLYYV